jgi:hypothetical protein
VAPERFHRLLSREGDRYLAIPLVLAILAGALLTEARTLVATLLCLAGFCLPGFLVFRPYSASAARAAVYGLPLGYSLTSLLHLLPAGSGGAMADVAVPFSGAGR